MNKDTKVSWTEPGYTAASLGVTISNQNDAGIILVAVQVDAGIDTGQVWPVVCCPVSLLSVDTGADEAVDASASEDTATQAAPVSLLSVDTGVAAAVDASASEDTATQATPK